MGQGLHRINPAALLSRSAWNANQRRHALEHICGRVHLVDVRYHPLFERWLAELADADEEVFGEVMHC
jgi:hypothetical protein